MARAQEATKQHAALMKQLAQEKAALQIQTILRERQACTQVKKAREDRNAIMKSYFTKWGNFTAESLQTKKTVALKAAADAKLAAEKRETDRIESKFLSTLHDGLYRLKSVYRENAGSDARANQIFDLDSLKINDRKALTKSLTGIIETLQKRSDSHSLFAGASKKPCRPQKS